MWNNLSQGVKEVSQIYMEFIGVQQIKENERF